MFWLFWLLMTVVGAVYSTVRVAMTGQTLGKQVVGIIVLEPEGHIIPWQTAASRATVAVGSALAFGLGFLWMLWDKNGQTWQDKAANTLVFQYEEIV